MNVKATTTTEEYTEILKSHSKLNWKKILDVQRPYRWNIKRLELGKTLDVGCGIGRNLMFLESGSLGIDHNSHSVRLANGFKNLALTVTDFNKVKSKYINHFDSMLIAHVLEHMRENEAKKLIKSYLPYVKKKIVVICPQEKGFTKDNTHINYLDSSSIEKILKTCGLCVVKSYSFPFHKKFGRFFTYNETVVIAKKD